MSVEPSPVVAAIQRTVAAAWKAIADALNQLANLVQRNAEKMIAMSLSFHFASSEKDPRFDAIKVGMTD
jgi:hypothetical protein